MKQIRVPRYQRGISRQAAIWLLIALGAAGTGAFLYWPSGNPLAPILTSPADGVEFGRSSPNNPVLLQWRQGGGRSLTNRQPPRAVRFVTCVSKSEPPSNCGGNGTDAAIARRSIPAPEIDRTLVEGAGLIDRLRKVIDPVFDYQHLVRIPENATPSDFQWTVGACSGPGPGVNDCTFAQPGRHLGVRDINIVMDDLSDNSTTSSAGLYAIQITMGLSNLGTEDTGPFDVLTQVWRIRDNVSQDPVTNLGDPSVHPSDHALYVDGLVVPVAEAEQARVRGIIPGGTVPINWVRHYGDLDAGTVITAGEHPCGNPPCLIEAHPTQPSGTFFLFAVVSRADANSQVTETDETDNTEYKGSVEMFIP